ncbi:hypothetical protein [Haloferula sp. A504]|uniref:hypothetical protein n=1 Tax=Haloferula sp. A504 TaxID=3373601 RepID=UPI0031C70720|nr:hypothetical protein [Verrucomicrobiaceae bacterium E54]
MTRDEIIARIRKIEALYQGTGEMGEKQAAESALNRLVMRLDTETEQVEEEFQFSLPDPWKRKLFLALARRHGLKPYRYPRQRHSTVMLRITKKRLDIVLWPEFKELSEVLSQYLAQATDDIITRGVHGDLSEAPQQPNLPLD